MRATSTQNAAERLVGGVVAVLLVLSLPVAFVLAIGEWFPTSWFIQLQLLWNDGYYYSKLTFLLTWLSILVAILVPVEVLSGVLRFGRGWLRQSADLSSASSTRAMLSRLVRLAGGCAGGALSLGVLGICVVGPELFDPLGLFAVLLLFVGILGPPIALLFVLDGLCPSEVIDGVVEGHPVVPQSRGAPIRKLRVAGRDLSVPIDVWNGTPDGTRVRVVVSGYLGAYLAIDRG